MSAARLELVGLGAHGRVERVEVPEVEACVVGAGPGADLEWALPGLAARHLRLEREGERVVATDLGGGLRVNGRSVASSPVTHLDVLALGDARVVLLAHEGGAGALARRHGVCAAWLQPEPSGPRVSLAAGENACGRAAEAAVVVADPTASKRHARIVLGFDAVTVEDLGSANGTRVNGALVARARLFDGDRVAFGAASFRVGIEEGDREVTLPPRRPVAGLDPALLSAETTAFEPVVPPLPPERR
ncbi:MAG: FHA domain-containing protein [Vicinamibacteria bacterium]|nr:FHA domain-containing protein [Vicinamibacteria bacterium]